MSDVNCRSAIDSQGAWSRLWHRIAEPFAGASLAEKTCEQLELNAHRHDPVAPSDSARHAYLELLDPRAGVAFWVLEKLGIGAGTLVQAGALGMAGYGVVKLGQHLEEAQVKELVSPTRFGPAYERPQRVHGYPFDTSASASSREHDLATARSLVARLRLTTGDGSGAYPDVTAQDICTELLVLTMFSINASALHRNLRSEENPSTPVPEVAELYRLIGLNAQLLLQNPDALEALRICLNEPPPIYTVDEQTRAGLAALVDAFLMNGGPVDADVRQAYQALADALAEPQNTAP